MMPPYKSGSPVLRSPVILGGLAIVVIAIVTTLTMGILSGSDESSNGAAPSKTAAPRQTQTAEKLMGKAEATINVRSDPGNDFQVLGVLRRGTEVEIVGKSEDGEWFEIVYPADSDLRGWVLAESLEVEGDLGRLGVATPDQIVEPPERTYEPAETEPPPTPADTPTSEAPTLEPTAVPSPTVVALPDLVIGGALVSGGVIVVTITNQGAGPLADAVVDVTIFDASSEELLYSLTTGPHSLQAGGSIDVKTDFAVPSGLSQLMIEVDSAGAIEESDDSNNRFSIAISAGAGGSDQQQQPQEPQP
jgi:hypothetical protein